MLYTRYTSSVGTRERETTEGQVVHQSLVEADGYGPASPARWRGAMYVQVCDLSQCKLPIHLVCHQAKFISVRTDSWLGVFVHQLYVTKTVTYVCMIHLDTLTTSVRR